MVDELYKGKVRYIYYRSIDLYYYTAFNKYKSFFVKYLKINIQSQRRAELPAI